MNPITCTPTQRMSNIRANFKDGIYREDWEKSLVTFFIQQYDELTAQNTYLQEQGTTQVTRIRELEEDVARVRDLNRRMGQINPYTVSDTETRLRREGHDLRMQIRNLQEMNERQGQTIHEYVQKESTVMKGVSGRAYGEQQRELERDLMMLKEQHTLICLESNHLRKDRDRLQEELKAFRLTMEHLKTIVNAYLVVAK